MLNKIISLLRETKRTQKDLCTYLGLNPWTFSEWKAGKSESYKKYLPQIAEFFGCSVDYLLGKEQKKEAVQKDSLIEEKKDEIRRLFDRMSPDQQETFLLEGYRIVFGKNSKDNLSHPAKHSQEDDSGDYDENH